MFTRRFLIFTVFSLVLLSACAPIGEDNFGGSAPTAGSTMTPASGLKPSHSAAVSGLEFLLLESFPVQVHAIVKGTLPDACTTIASATAAQVGNDFTLTLTTARDATATCAQAFTPIEQNIALDVYGLPNGVYTATANGVSATIELTSDNLLRPEPTSAPADDSGLPTPSSICGAVWADCCVLLGGEGASATPSGGCAADAADGYRANGEWGEGEGRLAGVAVSLLPGNCPGDAARLITAITDPNGTYRFGKLNAGTYCIAIDALQPQNAPLLVPSDWTFPAVGVGYLTLNLGAGENKTEVNFGWDAQFNLSLTQYATRSKCCVTPSHRCL